MAAKFGLVLLIALVCALSFLAGTVAPDSVRQALAQVLAKLSWPGVFTSTAVSAATPASTGAQAAGSSAPAAAATAALTVASAPTTAASAPAAVPLSSLLVPSQPPATGSYALQAGQFAVQQAANQLAASIAGQGVTSTVILTTDQSGTNWAVVGLGRFASPDEAVAQRAYLANKLGLPQYLPPISLAPAKAPP